MMRAAWAGVLALLWTVPAAANPFEDAILHQFNLARADPRAFVAVLREYRAHLSAKGIYSATGEAVVATREGVKAVDEAIAFVLRRAALPPLPTLSVSPLLAAAARDHSGAQSRSGAIGHESENGDGPGERAVARGGGDYVAETIAYSRSAATTVAIQLIVDDDVPDRGHREVIFDPEIRYAGAACAPHPRYGNVCTIDFSPTERGDPE